MLDAKAARELTQQHLKTNLVEPYLQQALHKIEEAAKKGLSSIQNPHVASNIHVGLPYPSWDLQAALWQRLRELGYTVKDHSDPDPGSPVSGGPYTEVSW